MNAGQTLVKRTLEQSKNWSKVEHEGKRLEPNEGLSGFPFDEGVPKNRRGRPVMCEIILRFGDRHFAQIDPLTRDGSRKVKWKLINVHPDRWVEQKIVAGWKEVER